MLSEVRLASVLKKLQVSDIAKYLLVRTSERTSSPSSQQQLQYRYKSSSSSSSSSSSGTVTDNCTTSFFSSTATTHTTTAAASSFSSGPSPASSISSAIPTGGRESSKCCAGSVVAHGGSSGGGNFENHNSSSAIISGITSSGEHFVSRSGIPVEFGKGPLGEKEQNRHNTKEETTILLNDYKNIDICSHCQSEIAEGSSEVKSTTKTISEKMPNNNCEPAVKPDCHHMEEISASTSSSSSTAKAESSSSSSTAGKGTSAKDKSSETTTCFKSSLSDIIQFLELVGSLKHTKRTGWVLRDVKDCESISGHMYRMSIMTFLLDRTEGLDRTKCMELALVHDLAESLVGDITPFCGISREEKRLREQNAMEDICQLIEPRGKRIMELFEEYEANESPESKFVKDLDRLDMILQAFEYEKRDNCVLKHQEFFDSTDGKFSHPFVCKLVKEIYSQRLELAKETHQNSTVTDATATAIATATNSCASSSAVYENTLSKNNENTIFQVEEKNEQECNLNGICTNDDDLTKKKKASSS